VRPSHFCDSSVLGLKMGRHVMMMVSSHAPSMGLYAMSLAGMGFDVM